MNKFDLHNDKKIDTGFKTPKNYFDSLEERIMQRISFDETKIETGFKVPENYFDSFEEKIMMRVGMEEKPAKVISIWQRKSVWISSVAAVFIVALSTWFYFQENSSQNTISSSEYLAYESDFSTEDIAQHLTDEDLASLEEELNTFDTQTENYINEYLN